MLVASVFFFSFNSSMEGQKPIFSLRQEKRRRFVSFLGPKFVLVRDLVGHFWPCCLLRATKRAITTAAAAVVVVFAAVSLCTAGVRGIGVAGDARQPGVHASESARQLLPAENHEV